MTAVAEQVAASSGDEADNRTSVPALVPTAVTTSATADPVESLSTNASNSDMIPSLSTAFVAYNVCHDANAISTFDSKGFSQRSRLAAPSDRASRPRHQRAARVPAVGIDYECHGTETLGEPPGLSEPSSKTGKKYSMPQIFSYSLSASPSERLGVARPAERASSNSFAEAGLFLESSLSCSATPVRETTLQHPLQDCTTPLLTGRSGGHSKSVRLHEQQRLHRQVRLNSSCSGSAERVRIEASGGSARRMRLDASAGLAKRVLESSRKSLEKLRPGTSIDTIQQLLLEASSSAKKNMPPDASAVSQAQVQGDAYRRSALQMPAPLNCGTHVPLVVSNGGSKRARANAKVRKPDDVTRRRRASSSSAARTTAQAEAASGHHCKQESVSSAGNARLTASASAAVSSLEKLQRRAVGSRSDIGPSSRCITKEKPWELTVTRKPISVSNGRVSMRETDCRSMPQGSRGSSGWTMPVAAECSDRDAANSVARAADDTPLAVLSRPVVLSKATHVSSDPRRLTESVGTRKAGAVDVVKSNCFPAAMSNLGVTVTSSDDGAPVYQRLLRMPASKPKSDRLLPSQMYEKWRQELQQKQPQCESIQSGKLQALGHQPKSVGCSPSGSEGSFKRSITDCLDSAGPPSSSAAAVVAITEISRGDDRIGGRKVRACRGNDAASTAGTAAVSKVWPKDVPVLLKTSSATRCSSRVVLPRRVSNVKDLTDDQLHLLIQKHLDYLRNVRSGKVDCWRHTAFGVASMRMLRSLDFSTPASIVTGQQLELIADTLSSDTTLCDSTLTSVDYVMRVLLPEMLTLLYMDVHNLSRRAADAALKKMCM